MYHKNIKNMHNYKENFLPILVPFIMHEDKHDENSTKEKLKILI